MNPVDFNTMPEAAAKLGRTVSPAELAELILLGEAIVVEDAAFVSKKWLGRQTAAAIHVRAHTRNYKPGAHPTLRGTVRIAAHVRKKR